jgi:transposase
MERAAPALWSSQYLLAPASAVGRDGGLLKRWRAFLAQLTDAQTRRWDACCADGRFISAQQGGPRSARRSGATVRSGWVWSMARGPPLGAYLEAAAPADVTRLEHTRETIAVGRPGRAGCPRKRPARVMADRGDDSTPLRSRLARRGIAPMMPARRHHMHATHQDGRKLRRDRRRWIVERTFAGLGHFRRLVGRYERLITTDAGFFHMACALLTLRRVLK